MLVKDLINKTELEMTHEEIMDAVAKNDRQVDLYFEVTRTDGYLTWDHENWVSVDGKRFVRSHFLKGKALSEASYFNKYDYKAEFKPEEAKEIVLG